MMLAAMLVAQVVAGVPMTTPIMLTSTLAIFGAAGVTWEPGIGWVRNFAGRIGMSVRKGTRAARQLPPAFARISRVFVLRFVWLVATYGLLPCFVFNMDETRVRFMPLKARTWAEKGAKQVDITALDDKRQFTAHAAGEVCGHVQ